MRQKLAAVVGLTLLVLVPQGERAWTSPTSDWAQVTYSPTDPELAAPMATQHLLLWNQRFGATLDDFGQTLTTDPMGNVIVTGGFQGSVGFGGETFVNTGPADVFLAKFDSNGNHLWSRRYGGSSAELGNGIATDAAGNIYVTGQFRNTVNFGGDDLTSAGDEDIFVAKYTPDGAHLWSRRFGGMLRNLGFGLAVDASGNVWITGRYRGSFDFGGATLVSAGSNDIFLAKLDTNGNHVWSAGFGNLTGDEGLAVAVDAVGDVYVTGAFSGSVGFGGPTLTSAGLNDIFVAKFSSSGDHRWSRRFGGLDNDTGLGICVDASQNVHVTGSFQGTVNFGGVDLTSAGLLDIFLVTTDPDGAHLWSGRFGDVGHDEGHAVVTDASGNLLLTGAFQQTVSFGGDDLSSAGFFDIFIAKFSPGGGHLWSRGAGNSVNDVGRSLAVDAAGNVFVTGDFAGMVNFGGTNLTSAGLLDIFLAKFAAPLNITGVATYWSASTTPLDGVELRAAQAYLPASPQVSFVDDIGEYSLGPFTPAGVPTGNGIDEVYGPVVLTARKTTDPGGDHPAITGNDCVLLFKNAAQNTDLTPQQERAGNVLQSPGEEDTNFSDAVACSGFLAFIDNPDNLTGTWQFDFWHRTACDPPTPRIETNEITIDIGALCNGTAVNPEIVDLHGFLLGDVDGSYAQSPKPMAPVDVKLSLELADPQRDEVRVRLLATVEREPLQTLVFSLTFDANTLAYAGAQTSAQSSGFFLLDNPADPGVVHGVLIGWERPLSESGALLELRFRRLGNATSTPLTFSRLLVNDRPVMDVPVLALRPAAGDRSNLPAVYALRVQPNPFNPATAVEYSIPPHAGTVPVLLRIYDASGRLVRTLDRGLAGPGTYRTVWNGTDTTGLPAASGMYFVRIEAGSWSQVEKVSLLK